MPIAHIYILEGRTDGEKENLISEVSSAISTTLKAPLTSVRVILNEMDENHFGIGGKTVSRLKNLNRNS